MQAPAAALAPVGLPTSALFRVAPGNHAPYLVETDPRFTNQRLWLGSDYLLRALALDPATTQKRLGDAFYEQQRAMNEKQQQAQFERQQAMLAKEINFIERFKARASHAAQVQSRVKKLEKIDRVEPPKRRQVVNFEFQPAQTPWRSPLKLHRRSVVDEAIVCEPPFVAPPKVKIAFTWPRPSTPEHRPDERSLA